MIGVRNSIECSLMTNTRLHIQDLLLSISKFVDQLSIVALFDHAYENRNFLCLNNAGLFEKAYEREPVKRQHTSKGCYSNDKNKITKQRLFYDVIFYEYTIFISKKLLRTTRLFNDQKQGIMRTKLGLSLERNIL